MKADERTAVLVIRDGEGNCFLLPQELLERGRVPEECKAEVERSLAAADDTAGYVVSKTAYTPPDLMADLKVGVNGAIGFGNWHKLLEQMSQG